MSTHYLISSGTDMIEFVGERLLEHKELSRCLAVFPGKRPGHFIRRYLAQHMKKVFQPPCILSIDGFIDHINAELGGSCRVVNEIDSLALIYRLNAQSRVIGTKGDGLTLDEFLPWGAKLFNDFEELCIEGIEADALEGVELPAREKMPWAISEKLASLSSLYTAFYEYIDKNNLTTRARAYKKAADGIEKAKLADFERIYICGLFALTKMERTIFKHLAQDDRVQYVFQKGPGIEETLKILNINCKKEGSEMKAPAMTFHRAMNSHGEIFGLNKAIKEERELSHRDVIVIPMPGSLFPILHSTIGFAKEYNISMGYPLHRTPLNTLISDLGRLIENRRESVILASDYIRLMLHPYVKNIYFDKASYPTRIIFHTIEEEFTLSQRRFVSLADIEDDERLLTLCSEKLRDLRGASIDREKISRHMKMIHNLLLRPFRNIKNIADCTEKVIRIISFISQHSPANEHPFTGSFIKTLIDGLYTLQVSQLGGEMLSSPERYFQLILNYMKSINHPFAGTPVRGLQVLGFLETRNIKFNRVFLLDANEGVLPHTVKEDTTLPHSVRKALHLTTIEEQERILKYYFSTLVSGSEQTHIFFIESEDKERSRFVERLIWNIQQEQGTLEYPSSEIFFRSDFSQNEFEAIPKTEVFANIVKRGLSFAPSNLDTYLSCPLRYYFGNILGLGKKKEIAEDPDAMGIGSLVHEILMYFFIPKIGKTLEIIVGDYERMDRIIDEVFIEKYPDASGGAVYMIKSQVKRRLRRFLKHHEDKPQFKGTIIRRCESVTEPDGKQKDYRSIKTHIALTNAQEVELRGRIDRIDEKDGMYRIIDYKTGSIAEVPSCRNFDLAHREEWSKTLKSVQLPLYILLYTQNNDAATVNNTDAGLLGLGGGTREEFEYRSLFKDVPDEQRQPLFEKYNKAIITLIEEILDMDRPFTKAEDEDVCKYCDFRVICGRQWVRKTW